MQQNAVSPRQLYDLVGGVPQPHGRDVAGDDERVLAAGRERLVAVDLHGRAFSATEGEMGV